MEEEVRNDQLRVPRGLSFSIFNVLGVAMKSFETLKKFKKPSKENLQEMNDFFFLFLKGVLEAG